MTMNIITNWNQQIQPRQTLSYNPYGLFVGSSFHYAKAEMGRIFESLEYVLVDDPPKTRKRCARMRCDSPPFKRRNLFPICKWSDEEEEVESNEEVSEEEEEETPTDIEFVDDSFTPEESTDWYAYAEEMLFPTTPDISRTDSFPIIEVPTDEDEPSDVEFLGEVKTINFTKSFECNEIYDSE